MLISRPPIPLVVAQHVESAAALWRQRSQLASSGHLRLHQLLRFDQRLAAQLDGVATAEKEGWTACEAAIGEGDPGALFALAVRSLESQSDRLEQLLTVGKSGIQTERALISAFGWLERDRLVGVVMPLLKSEMPFRRLIGIAACAEHRVNPGLVAAINARDPTPALRARQFRTAGEIGLLEVAPTLAMMTVDEDADCAMWAAWSAVLLGDRDTALGALTTQALETPSHESRPLRLILQARAVGEGRRVLDQLASNPQRERLLVKAVGLLGDSSYVEWLIERMANIQLSRVAGEAFSSITGADLALIDLERKPPEEFESGPNDNPDDPNVDMDPDDGLPWPDVERVEAWWAANSNRFQPGTRYFMGKPVTREHCIDVLKTGYQRQRILAAHYLCLLEPGTPLFNTSAPAWRQQRLLAAM